MKGSSPRRRGVEFWVEMVVSVIEGVPRDPALAASVRTERIVPLSFSNILSHNNFPSGEILFHDLISMVIHSRLSIYFIRNHFRKYFINQIIIVNLVGHSQLCEIHLAL
jgi:hypothetical protein